MRFPNPTRVNTNRRMVSPRRNGLFSSLALLAIVLTASPLAAQFPPTGPIPGQPNPEFNQPLDPFAPGPGPAAASPIVLDVRIVGNERISANQMLARLKTRPDRAFDPDLLQADTQELMLMKEFRNVRPFVHERPEGVIVTFEVSEKPRIERVNYIGNRGITTRVLSRESGIKEGDPLDLYGLRLAKERLEGFYRSKGYAQTEVEIVEGTEPDARVVTFLISEDVVRRVADVEFIGNEFVSGARLESFIKSKPGMFAPVYRNKYTEEVLTADRDRLTSYYRQFGFFRAVVDTEVVPNEDHSLMSVRFVIYEGPRYRVRNIAVAGNEVFRSEDLYSLVELQEGENFDGSKMERDIAAIKDLYGGNGYIQATVDGQTLFLEEPGWVDLVFQISEGEQYRVGRINVNISGEYGVTRQSAVLARLDLRPGDIIDIRKIRDSERRLGASGLFVADPSMGQMPTIELRPSDPDFADHASTAFRDALPDGNRDPRLDGFRGQSPDGVLLDIEVFGATPARPRRWYER